MTGDQRLVLKIESALRELAADQLIACFHVIDEIVRELDAQTREAIQSPAHDRRAQPREKIAAAG